MKTFLDHMSIYAAYHRDTRNIMTHLVGVPVIVFAVILLLSRPTFEVLGYTLSPAIIGFAISMVFYFSLNIAFGLIMAVIMGAGVYFAASLSFLSIPVWAMTGIGLFVAGWIVQFIGHHWEGKKPAFVDDLVGLLIGPMFVTAEILFALGMFKDLKEDIEGRVGGTHNGAANQA